MGIARVFAEAGTPQIVWRECSECYLFFKTEAGNGKRICPECELEQEARERA